MPRIARGQLERGVFHVLNRGNHRQTLFRHPEDFALFLDLLGGSVPKFAVKMWGYCLMGNHWHLVVEVENIKDLSAWMHWLCNRHVRLAHRENAALGGGHIYQGATKVSPSKTRATCTTCCATWKPTRCGPSWCGGHKTGFGRACPRFRSILVWWKWSVQSWQHGHATTAGRKPSIGHWLWTSWMACVEALCAACLKRPAMDQCPRHRSWYGINHAAPRPASRNEPPRSKHVNAPPRTEGVIVLQSKEKLQAF